MSTLRGAPPGAVKGVGHQGKSEPNRTPPLITEQQVMLSTRRRRARLSPIGRRRRCDALARLSPNAPSKS
jgi:hypothetical protein